MSTPDDAALVRDEAALLRLAFDAATKAVRVHAAGFSHAKGERLVVQKKASAIDLVTAVDRDAERAIVDVLRASDVPIIAEEAAGALGLVEGPVWYVDPLDGTTNYANGHPFFCVSIGLAVDGIPRLGVVWAWAISTVWRGTRTEATRHDTLGRGEHAIVVSPVDTLGEVLVATGFPYDRRTSSDDNLAAHNALMKRTQGVMRCGSAAIDLCLVADGTYGGYWERKLKPWDYAAGAAFVVAAGGTITDPWGRPFRVEHGDALASNGLVHDELRTALEPHLPPPPPRAA
ncbi:MAG: inositol monophosphatase family protein [Polyangiales bacterium]